MRPRIAAVINEALDQLIAQGPEFDIVHDLADVIPARVVVTYLGFPDEVRVPFIKAVQDSVSCIPMLGQASPDGPTPEQTPARASPSGASPRGRVRFSSWDSDSAGPPSRVSCRRLRSPGPRSKRNGGSWTTR